MLLDAVDEMAVADALHQIAIQVNELRNVRIVLTCRLNVWDAGKNTLDRFDVYRNLDFEYPSEVHQFIDRWFEAEPKLQEKLKSDLEKPGKERIRDMVKNPLRLTLLCYSWQLQQGELPETKAGLYEWFVNTFYEWNKGKVAVKLNSTKRDELNRALGELAKTAIDQKSSRFRLPEKLVKQFLGDADDEGSLFSLALELGWLNRIGIAEENPLENVYAFFHPTFQEYFAALAIESNDFFLPNEHNNIDPKPVLEKRYRFSDVHWGEVFLIWCGIASKSAEVEQLIKKLLNFQSGCRRFHFFMAYFLAASAASELQDCRWLENILDSLIDLAFFTQFSSPNNYWSNCPIQEKATEALQFTKRTQTINQLSRRIETVNNPYSLQRLADFLGRISPRNDKAIEVLTSLLDDTKDKNTSIDIAKSLWLADPGNVNSINKFCELLDPEEEDIVSSLAAEAIDRNHIQSSEIISSLTDLSKRHGNDFTLRQRRILRALEKVGVGNRFVIDTMIELIDRAHSQQNFENQRILIWVVGEVGSRDLKASEYLVSLLSAIDDNPSRWLIADSLGRISDDHPNVIDALNLLTDQSEDEWTRQQAAESLLRIDPDHPTALALLINLLSTAKNWRTQKRVIVSLGRVAFGNLQAIGAISKLLENGLNSSLCKQAAETLGEIDPGNDLAISVLIRLLNNENNSPGFKEDIIWALGNVGKGNLSAITALVQLFEREYDHIEDNFIKYCHRESLHWVARSLCKIINDTSYQFVVQNLKKYVCDEAYENEFAKFKSAYEVIWYCANGMNYPLFYQAWQTSPSSELSTE